MNKNGFSLIELLIVMLTLAVLFAMAVPSYSRLLQRQEVRSHAHTLSSMVYLARSEAIKKSSVVTVCKSTSDGECGGSWSYGWVMFSDHNKDGSRDVSDEIITSHQFSKRLDINWSAFGSNNYIRFTPRGMTIGQNGTFTICPNSGDEQIARTVVVSKLARVRMPTAGKNADGEMIDCEP